MTIAASIRTPAFSLRTFTTLALLICLPLFARAGAPVQHAAPSFAPAHATALSSDICIIPALSSPSIKNGDTVTISAVINARHGVAKVEAEIIRQRDLVSATEANAATPHAGPPDLASVAKPLARLTLAPAAPGVGGVSADGTRGLWTTTWTGAHLEETFYTIRIRVTDRRGQTAEDQSLTFSDPIAGIDTPGTNNYGSSNLLLNGATSRGAKPGIMFGLVDPLRGYAYFFSRNGSQRSLVKAALGPGDTAPRIVGSIAVGGGDIRDTDLDPVHAFAYVSEINGSVSKYQLGNGDELPRMVANSSGANVGYFLGLVPQRSLGFWTTVSYLRVMDLNQSIFSQLSITGPFGDFGLADPNGDYLYIITNRRITKVSAGAGPSPPGGFPVPAAVGKLEVTGVSGNLMPIEIDAEGGHAWFYSTGTPASIVKIELGDGDTSPTLASILTLQPGEGPVRWTIPAKSEGIALLGLNGNPSRVVKIGLADGSSTPTRLGVLSLPGGDGNLVAAGYDPISHTAIVGSVTTGQVIKLGLGDSDGPPVRLNASSPLPFNIGAIVGIITDPNADYAVLLGANSRMQKLALGDLNTLPYPIGSSCPTQGEVRGVLDAENAFAYLAGVGLSKYDLGALDDTPVLLGNTPFSFNEGSAISVVADLAWNQAWIGTNQNPARAVKMDLGEGEALPTRLGAAVFISGEASPYTAVIDPAAGFAYFGTNSAPGRVVKVALGAGTAAPTRVGAVALDSGENYLFSSMIDPQRGYALFGTYTNPGRIVKVSLGAGSALPTREGAVTLNGAESTPAGALYDPASGRVFFTTLGDGPSVVSIDPRGPGESPLRLGAYRFSQNEKGLYGGILHSAIGALLLFPNNPETSIHRMMYSQKGFIKFTRFSLPEPARVQSLAFYSHVPEGSLRLALYREQTPDRRELVWESQTIPNESAGGFIAIPVNNGVPDTLTLEPGIFHLAWQVDTTASVPSRISPAFDTGSYITQPFGPFPALLDPSEYISWTNTAEAWTGYIQYNAITQSNPVWMRIGGNAGLDE